MTKGWFLESAKHAMAAKGIAIGRKPKNVVIGRQLSYPWVIGYKAKNPKEVESIIQLTKKKPGINAYVVFFPEVPSELHKKGFPTYMVQIQGKTIKNLEKMQDKLKSEGFVGH